MDKRSENFSPKALEIEDWGLLEYGEAFLRQKALVEERIVGSSSDRLALVEHPPVVTIGRSGSLEDLRISKEALAQKGAALYQVDRGGMATFHGPGQLVAYPIVKLEMKDLHLFLRTLQQALASVVRSYGLNPEFRNGTPGLWIRSAKVASIGIAVRKWVTYHGVALNVSTNPQWFNWIVPCGHPNEKITSMERELGYSLDMARVKELFIKAFTNLFGYTKSLPARQNASKHPRLWRRSFAGGN
jgi:lipoic acid synthetase